MTLLSRKADYALLILWYLDDRSEGSNARAIAERFGLSRPFVANILKELCHLGFVSSQRGVKGGYTLVAGVPERTLSELLFALGEQFRLTICNSPDAEHENCTLEHDCPVKGPLAELNERIIDLLHQVKLKDLFSKDCHEMKSPLIPLGIHTTVKSFPAENPADPKRLNPALVN